MTKTATPTETASEFEQAMNRRGWTSRTPLETGRKVTFIHKSGSRVHAQMSGIHVTVVYGGQRGTMGHISPVRDQDIDTQVESWLSRVSFIGL